MENPFLFGEVVKGFHFANREEALKTLSLDLSSGQNILLFSPRRYGKTSLMMRVLDSLRSKGLICVYVDFFRVTSMMSLGKIYANALTQASASKLQEAVQFVKDHFPTIIPKIVMKGEGTPEIEVDFDAPHRDLEKWLDQVYEMPQKIAEKKRKRVVVVFDEFQEIASLSANGAVERALRSRIQHHNRVSYVFMGSKRHLLDELFLDKARPLYNVAKTFPLGKILPAKWQSFIKTRLDSVHISIGPALIDRIIALSDAHPYYTQQLCHEVFNTVGPGKKVTPAHIDQALESCLLSQSYAYSTIWDSLTGKQRDLLLALANTESPNIYSLDFITRFDLGSPGTVQRSVDGLIKKGLIDRDAETYNVTDVFLCEWLRQKMTL